MKRHIISISDVFIAQLQALNTSRSIKTRRLTVAEEDSELGKMAKLAQVCKEIYSSLASCKGELNGRSKFSSYCIHYSWWVLEQSK